MYSISCNKYKQYFCISYTHIRYLGRHGEEIPVLLFGVCVNIIHCENSGEDLTSESYISGVLTRWKSQQALETL